MIWIAILLLGLGYVLAIVLKTVFYNYLKEYSSFGLAVRIILFLIGALVIGLILALVFNW